MATCRQFRVLHDSKLSLGITVDGRGTTHMSACRHTRQYGATNKIMPRRHTKHENGILKSPSSRYSSNKRVMSTRFQKLKGYKFGQATEMETQKGSLIQKTSL